MAFDSELLKGHARLLILSVVRDGPAHGYRIAARLDQRSKGILHLREGSLYPALHRLEQDGCLRSGWETSEQGRRRKVYQITDDGLRELAAMSRQWERVTSAVKLVMRGATA